MIEEKRANGSCVCGAIAYQIEPPYITFQYCHCSRCKKGSGSAHATNLFVKTDLFQWTRGEEKVRRWEHPDAKYWSRCFCEDCGSSVPWITRTQKAFIVPTGTLDDDPGIRPQRNIMCAYQSPWFIPVPELPSFDEYPPKGS